MRNGEAGYVEIANGEAAAGLEGLPDGRVFAPVDIGCGAARQIDGNEALAGARGGTQADGMVAMFVCDQDGVKRRDVFPDGRQALVGFAAAQPGIDEYARPVGRDERRVTGTAARKNTNFDDAVAPGNNGKSLSFRRLSQLNLKIDIPEHPEHI
jgi:hypothetical protein